MISYYFTLTLRTVEIDNIRVITYNVHVHTLSYFISFFVTEIVLTNIALVLYRVCACDINLSFRLVIGCTKIIIIIITLPLYLRELFTVC